MIRRHYLVEIKCVKELPLSTLLPPHHGPLPRITSQSDGITVRPWSQREFCNTFPLKADVDWRYGHVRLVPILLQKSLMVPKKSDSVAVMRFAVEASDDGAAQSRPR